MATLSLQNHSASILNKAKIKTVAIINKARVDVGVLGSSLAPSLKPELRAREAVFGTT